MQAIVELIFDIFYLTTVITLGLIMVKGSNQKSITKIFGYMAIVLGLGDAFHLVPRVYALFTTGLEANVVTVGGGKFITSVTMTVFYIMLYMVWKKRYQVAETKGLSTVIMGLGALRIGLCLMPQNKWFSVDAPLSWGIYRNIPFAIMGFIMIVLFFSKAKKHKDKVFSKMWLAIALSFGFYIPVVLFANTFPMVGMLMIPKTLAYVWIVRMGYKTLKEQ